MPVTHGVRGSSPLRTADFDSKRLSFQSLFLCKIVLYEQAQQPILHKM